MEAEMSYLLEEKTRKLENAEMLIEKLKEEVKELNFSVTMHDRAQVRRVERAEAVKESLTSALREIEEIAADGNLKAFRQICDIANAALRTTEESSVVDTTAKQPEVITKLDKALQNIDVVKRVLVENSCPSEFELEDCEFNQESGCTLCCEDCWNEEVGE